MLLCNIKPKTLLMTFFRSLKKNFPDPEVMLTQNHKTHVILVRVIVIVLKFKVIS